MIKCIKILSYKLKPDQGDVFDYLNSITNQTIDPSSFEPGRLDCGPGVVLYSTLKRAVGCIKMESGNEYIKLDDLKEIPFDLEKICGRSAWEKEASVAVRRAFKEAFVNDQLSVARLEIFNGIRRILDLCYKKAKSSNVFIISHSFRLALIEAYIKTNGLIETQPELIHDFISNNKKRYEFGGGFEVDKKYEAQLQQSSLTLQKQKYHLRQSEQKDAEFLFKVKIEAMRPISSALKTVPFDYNKEFEGYLKKFEPEKVQVIQYEGKDIGRLRIVRSAESIYIGGIQILPEYQGKGIGSAIISNIIIESESSRTPITLEVHQVNNKAISFYRKLGFKEKGKVEGKMLMGYVPHSMSH